jgi:Fe-S-cluster containining protein
VEDSEQIIDMLEIDPRKPGHYNCRHYDSRSGRCLTYERRPAMCSRYPYDSDCPFCTYDPKKPDVPGVLREVPLP